MMRNGPSNIVFFSCRDTIRSLLPDSADHLGLLADFFSGACLGAFISTVFYPINTTKTHMQVSGWAFGFVTHRINQQQVS